MKLNLLLTSVFFVLFFGLKAQNSEWQTSLEEGFRIGVEENKNILVEFGVIQDGTPLFIKDEVWSDEAIVNKLSSFIPVSVDLANKAELSIKYDISYAPTLMLFTPKGELVFRTEGFLDKFQLDEVLTYLQSGVRKVCQFKTVFTDEDVLGNLLILEEYIKGSIKAPRIIQDDFLRMGNKLLWKLDDDLSAFDPVQKQRFKILETLLEQIDYPSESNVTKLYKMGRKNLITSNHSLLLFAISYGEYENGDEVRAKEVYEELRKRLGEDKQAADYCGVLESSLGFK